MDPKHFPPGYRFRPTDEELMKYYLKNKISGRILPNCNHIHEVNLYEHHPQTLTRMFKLEREEEWYFFTKRDMMHPKGNRPKRAAKDGFWHVITKVTVQSSTGCTLGYKRGFDFYENQGQGSSSNSNPNKTHWKMYEYTLIDNHNIDTEVDTSWAVCKIYRNSRGGISVTTTLPAATQKPTDDDLQREANRIYLEQVAQRLFLDDHEDMALDEIALAAHETSYEELV